MGCSTSSVSPGEDEQTVGVNKHQNTSIDKKHIVANEHQNGHVKTTKTNNSSLEWNKQAIDKNGNKLSSLSQAPVPKSVAFDVTLDGLSGELGGKKRPRKLQTLEPLSVPKLTAEQLQEKQKIADEKREKLKQRKVSASLKSSRRRRELIEAREFEMKLNNEQNKEGIDSIKPDELKREQHLIEIKEKQQLREERAKRVEERENTWLGVPDRTYPPDVEEHGLHKRVGQVRPTLSASTNDSYDAAFMRNSTQQEQKLQPIHNLNNSTHIMNDDFFDS